jgi:hypothetical protein
MPPTPTPLPSTATSTATATPQPTPTATPLPTATATPVPTFAPATPAPVSAYGLRTWTAEEADALVVRLERYPEELAPEARGYNDAAYYGAFRYAALAQREALARFPEAPMASHWRWGMAYDELRAGDPHASPHYAALIEQALRDGVTDVASLPGWFQGKEARLELMVVTPSAGDFTGELLQLSAGDSATYFWLLPAPEPRVYPLAGASDFDLASGAGYSFGIAGIAGADRQTFVSVHGHRPGTDASFYYTDLVLYDLGERPPRRLALQPAPATHLGWSDNDGWSVVRGDDGEVTFRLRGVPSDRCDSIVLSSDYRWNGQVLALVDTHYEVKDAAAAGRFCLPFLFAAAEAGDPAALRVMADAVQQAGAGDERLDEWRYRLALYQALAGDVEEARVAFTTVFSDPVDVNSEWVRSARNFRGTYQTAEDIYRACLGAELCDRRRALQQLGHSLSPAAYGLVAATLRDWGVPLNRTGFFDLDGDGAPEQWLLVNAPAFRMELWLLLRGGGALQLVFVDELSRDDRGFVLDRLTPVQGQAIIRARTPGEERLFVLTGAGDSKAQVLLLRSESEEEGGNYTARFLEENRTALLRASGTQAEQVLVRLLAFRRSDAFACTVNVFASICPDYDYVVALALELAGDEAGAVAAYRDLWQRYPGSAYALVARSRLAPAPDTSG